MPVDDVLDQLRAKQTRDVDWAAGRTFGMVYDGGPSVTAGGPGCTALEFLHECAEHQGVPSLGAVQSEVVRWTAGLFHGPDTASGFLTSGGTESILCAVLATRRRGKAERGVTRRNGDRRARAAFWAAHLFGVTVHKTKVRADWTADVDEMAAAVNDRTVLVVGSARPSTRRA
ncbi:MAG: aminotransferase class V-fold PLP-dependent enzyme [Ilumatobacteraceae bacterium]